jgi:hypothetical protein
MYSVTFPEFDENNSLKRKNNYSTSSYTSFNSLDNFLSKLTSLNSLPMLFLSVLSQHESEQHLNSVIVFPSLFSLSPVLSHSLIVDSSCSESEFRDLFFHLVYGTFTSPPFSPNKDTGSPMISKQFEAFYQLSVHVFSSSSSFYYSLH